MKFTHDTACPMKRTLGIIGGKWKTIIIWYISQGSNRFGLLKSQIEGISEKMLSQTLHELEADSIISKKIYPVVPPKVEYSLTEKGLSVLPILEAMHQWGSTLDEPQA